jgi:hypothetical protein
VLHEAEAGLVGDVAGDPTSLMFDLAVLVLITVASSLSMCSARTMARWGAAVLLAIYVAFMARL